MSKTNFSKVESALEEGLRQMSINKLFELADEASGIAPPAKAEPDSTLLTLEQKRILRALQLNMTRITTKEPRIYAKLGVKKSVFKILLATPSEPKNWEQLQKIYNKSKELIKSHFPTLTDEELVEKELDRHINKRLNVNEKWLPLK